MPIRTQYEGLKYGNAYLDPFDLLEVSDLSCNRTVFIPIGLVYESSKPRLA